MLSIRGLWMQRGEGGGSVSKSICIGGQSQADPRSAYNLDCSNDGVERICIKCWQIYIRGTLKTRTHDKIETLLIR